MICGRCGEQLEAEDLFCTACGSKVSPSEQQSQFSEKIKENKIIDKVNCFIERFGDRKLNKYLSIAAIISMISIRLFGFIAITLLVTIVNALLIFHNFKQNAKLDVKMLVLSLAVFFAGLLIVI